MAFGKPEKVHNLFPSVPVYKVNGWVYYMYNSRTHRRNKPEMPDEREGSNNMNKFKVFALNNGTLILNVQNGDEVTYAHAYDYPVQIEIDVKALLAGEDVTDWDGNELEEIGVCEEIPGVELIAWGDINGIEFSEKTFNGTEAEFANMFGFGLEEVYANWREVCEEMLQDGFKGTTDCGESTAREDFSAFAELKSTISFEDMYRLEKAYNSGK